MEIQLDQEKIDERLAVVAEEQEFAKTNRDEAIAKGDLDILDVADVIAMEEQKALEEPLIPTTTSNLYISVSPNGLAARLVPVTIDGIEVPDAALSIVGSANEEDISKFMNNLSQHVQELAVSRGLAK